MKTANEFQKSIASDTATFMINRFISAFFPQFGIRIKKSNSEMFYTKERPFAN